MEMGTASRRQGARQPHLMTAALTIILGWIALFSLPRGHGNGPA